MDGLSAKVQLHKEYEGRGVEVITVNLEGEAGMEDALEKLKEHDIRLTNWCFVEAMNDEVTDTLQFELLPTLNVYDKKGRLRESIEGDVNHSELQSVIEELLGEG